MREPDNIIRFGYIEWASRPILQSPKTHCQVYHNTKHYIFTIRRLLYVFVCISMRPSNNAAAAADANQLRDGETSGLTHSDRKVINATATVQRLCSCTRFCLFLSSSTSTQYNQMWRLARTVQAATPSESPCWKTCAVLHFVRNLFLFFIYT